MLSHHGLLLSKMMCSQKPASYSKQYQANSNFANGKILKSHPVSTNHPCQDHDP